MATDNFPDLDAALRGHANRKVRRAWERYVDAPRYRRIDGGMGFRAAMIWYHDRPGRYPTAEERLLRAIRGDYTIMAIDGEGRILSESAHKRNNGRPLRSITDWRLSSRFGKSDRPSAMDHLLRPGCAFACYDMLNAEEGVDVLRMAGLLTDTNRNRLTGLLTDFERRMAKDACRSLAAHLDGRTLNRMKALRLPRQDAIYNWLLHPDGEVRKRRLQAAEAFPFFCESVVNGYSPVREERLLALEAVDQGRPLLSLLASLFGVREATIRRLRRLGAREIVLMGRAPLDKLVRLMDGVPYEYWPKQAGEWRHVARMVADYPFTSMLPEEMVVEFMAGEMRKAGRRGWQKGAERYFEQFRYVRGLEDLRDFFGGIDEVLEMDRVEDYQGMTGRIRELLAPYGMKRLLAWNEAWHRSQFEMAYEKWPHEEDISWPPLSEPFDGEARTIVPLTNPDELFAEGKIMGHCVGGYVNRCINGHSYILSCRDRHGCCRSTIEIGLQNGMGELLPVVIQHRGHKNRAPSAACRRALAAYRERLARLGQEHFRRLEEARRERVMGDRTKRYERWLRLRHARVLKMSIPSGLYRELMQLRAVFLGR